MNASNNGNGSSTQEYQIVFGVFQGSDEDWIPAYLKVDGWLFWTLVVIGYTSYQSFIKFFAPWYWPHYNPLAKSKQADNWGFPLTWQLRTENPLDIANWTDPTRNDPLNQMTVVRAERQDKPPCDCQIGRR
ncbi:unnamed protein product [Cyprideis torosa]|uniref:Uncharacterized protein n=1 Tax=Cyprideis torosa TaxID=163714 RepID=A0A7R8WHK2_9CRUS|nr:unnamed protein product [Cyprideis torosa]CAG0893889.1 unnamed protein product [Cyprideis torosa]